MRITALRALHYVYCTGAHIRPNACAATHIFEYLKSMATLHLWLVLELFHNCCCCCHPCCAVWLWAAAGQLTLLQLQPCSLRCGLPWWAWSSMQLLRRCQTPLLASLQHWRLLPSRCCSCLLECCSGRCRQYRRVGRCADTKTHLLLYCCVIFKPRPAACPKPPDFFGVGIISWS